MVIKIKNNGDYEITNGSCSKSTNSFINGAVMDDCDVLVTLPDLNHYSTDDSNATESSDLWMNISNRSNSDEDATTNNIKRFIIPTFDSTIFPFSQSNTKNMNQITNSTVFVLKIYLVHYNNFYTLGFRLYINNQLILEGPQHSFAHDTVFDIELFEVTSTNLVQQDVDANNVTGNQFVCYHVGTFHINHAIKNSTSKFIMAGWEYNNTIEKQNASNRGNHFNRVTGYMHYTKELITKSINNFSDVVDDKFLSVEESMNEIEHDMDAIGVRLNKSSELYTSR